MAGELGKASLDLEANLSEFRRNIAEGRKSAGGMEESLDAVAAIAEVAKEALERVKMRPGQGAETQASAEGILSGVRGISGEAREAARALDRVKLDSAQAAESEAVGDVIDRILKRINRNANETRRSLDRVKLAGGVPGRSGVGVGPFGSGFGRIGVLGAAVGLGALTAPALAPATGGLLAAIPALAGVGVGALGTLALAFDGVGKAIRGDKKAFDELGPAAQRFTLTVRSLDGFFDKLRQTAGASLFPGLTAGLRAALSPGTVSAVTKAITEFGHAIGQAGTEWGRYFGSAEFRSIFGPLMQDGARNFGVLARAALSLFDAVGVLGRAAIPLTNWITDGIAKGARLADAWLHAKNASGGLAHAMSEAQTSLRLVGGLGLSLLRVVGALGRALYPLSKVAVKALTDGLNALAGIIHRNQGVIRALVGTALTGLVTAVKVAAAGVRLFNAALSHIVGHKAGIVTAVLAIGIAISLALGPGAAAVTGAILAVGLIKNHWRTIVVFFRTLGIEIRHAFKYAWVTIEHGAIMAALKVVEPFSHLPAFLGGWARKAKNHMQAELAKLHRPNMDWSAAAALAGAKTGGAWRAAFEHSKTHAHFLQVGTKAPAGFKPGTYGTRPSTLDNPGGFQRLPKGKGGDGDGGDGGGGGGGGGAGSGELLPYRFREALAKAALTKSTADDKAANKAAYDYLIALAARSKGDKHLAALEEAQSYSPANVFGAPPPFTSNLGPKPKKPSVIPAGASHLEQLASAEASKAGALGNVGAVARRHLEAELADLQQAARLIRDKYEHAHGKAKTALFAALTRDENRIRSVHKLLGKAIKDRRAQHLQFAVDQAKDAVAAATEGTRAYDKAVKAEEKALRAQIRYLDRIVHNRKASLEARTKALRLETADRKALKALLGPLNVGSASAAANERQFLASFQAIVGAYAPNADPAPAGGGKTDTHLYEIKHELRQQTPHLKKLTQRARFPATDYGMTADAAMGVA